MRRRTVLLLFLAFRLMTLLTFRAEDLTLFGDYRYYYELASFSDQGHLPFIDYWSEHLPLFPFLSVGLYQLSRLFSNGSYQAYVYLLGTAMILVETTALRLFMKLAERVWGEERAHQLGWTYSLLFIPFIFAFWTFEAVTSCLILASLWLLVTSRERGSALAVGAGALTKLVPVLVVPAVMRGRPLRRWLTYALIILLVVAVPVGLLLAAGGPYAAASFRSILSRPSYETVWALIDGNLTTGLLGPPVERFDVSKAGEMAGNPARIPGWLRTGLFGLVGLTVFWRAELRESPRRLVSFVCLTVVLFLLWSKGWSPQWQVFLFPLVLLALPYQRALLFVMTLSAVNLAEWPVLLSRGLDEWLYLTVPLRTGLLILLVFTLWNHVRPQDGTQQCT
jgi:hypothetical protein